MPRKPATEEQKQAARRRLQKAAAGVYAEMGATGVSARAIAQRAGVSVGTLYTYFGSLQGLMQSLWMQPVEVINARLTELAAATPEPAARLRALLEAYVAVSRDQPDLYRGAFLFVRPRSLPTPEREPLESAPFARLLITAVQDGQAAGVIRTGDPIQLAQLAWATVHGAIGLPVNFDRLAFQDTSALTADAVRLALTGLSAGG